MTCEECGFNRSSEADGPCPMCHASCPLDGANCSVVQADPTEALVTYWDHDVGGYVGLAVALGPNGELPNTRGLMEQYPGLQSLSSFILYPTTDIPMWWAAA